MTKAQKDAEYYQRNKERIKAKVAAYRIEHDKYYKEYHANRFQEEKDNPEFRAQRADKEHRRRARQRGAFQEKIDRQKVWERDEGICGICGKAANKNKWDLDHIVPLGPGEHSYENVRVTHPRCNRKKIPEDKRILKRWMDQ